MSIIFKPSGSLDVSTDPSDLPESVDKSGLNFTSIDMVRCKNLRLDHKGVVPTRDGSSILNSIADFSWQFVKTSDGWTQENITITNNANSITLQTNSGDPIFRRTVSFSGGGYRYMIANIKRLGGAGWDGAAVYKTSSHGESASFIKTISEPDISNFATVVWDMHDLTLGGDDWKNNTITGIRFDFGLGDPPLFDNDDKFEINWIVVSPEKELPINFIIEQGGNRYSFAGDQIYKNESSIKSGLTSAQWSGIKYKSFNDTTQNIFATNGTDRKRIEGSNVFEWGLDASSIAAEVFSSTMGEGTGLTGDYNAKYTYVRKSGSTVLYENNPSGADSAAVTLSNNSLTVSCESPNDPQITHIRLYRTTANGLLYLKDIDAAYIQISDFAYSQDWETDEITGTGYKYVTHEAIEGLNYTHNWEHDTTVFLNETVATGMHTWEPTLFDSITDDVKLGDQVAIDHNRPPLGSYVAGPAYNGTCFMVKDNNLHYCKPKQPEYWPSNHFIEVSTPHFNGQLVILSNGQPYYTTKNEIYYIQGTGHGTFFPLPMRAKTGAQSIFGAVSVKGDGIYHTGPDGIYLFAGSDKKITERTLEPLFRGETVNGIPGVSEMTSSWLHVFNNKLYFGYTSSGNTYPTNIIVFNLDTSRTAYYTYNDGSDIQISTIATDETNSRLLIGDSNGFVRQIEDSSNTKDSDTDVSWEVQSKDYTLQTRRHFPRFTKWDVDASDATSVNGSVILDGVIHQNHTITGDRITKRRLIKTGNGRRCAMRITGAGPSQIYMSEME